MGFGELPGMAYICKMKKAAITFLTILGCAAGVSAQDNFFDDKVIDKPVRHILRYNNDNWRLTGVVRTSEYTALLVRYMAAYMNQGWSVNTDMDDALIDPASGKRYPLLTSTGIPRDPDKLVMDHTVNDFVQDAVLMFPPIPESVKTVDTTLGIYGLDLGGVSVNNNGTTRFYNDKKNAAGNVTLDAVYDNGQKTIIYLTYYPQISGKVWVSKEAKLKDRATGKTYAIIGKEGLPWEPESVYVNYNKYHDDNPPIGVCYIFPSMQANGVDSFDLENGNWSIAGI